jgi:hypothetical protein
MSEALIIHLDRDEARAPTPPEGPPCTLWLVLVAFTMNSRRSNFLEFFGAPDGAASRHGWRIW